MRNIKFRGRTADGEWVYGYFALHHYNKYAVKNGVLTKEGEIVKANIYNDTRKDKSYWTEVEEESVEEFTGLYDRKGREIYEGDIVKTQLDNEPFGTVTWHEHGYFFIDTTYGHWSPFDEYAPLGKIMDTFIDDKKIQVEIIGNVYDNPELLKEETRDTLQP